LDPVTTAFKPASIDLKNHNILHQTILYAASIRTDLDSLGGGCDILFNVLPSPIYVLAIT